MVISYVVYYGNKVKRFRNKTAMINSLNKEGFIKEISGNSYFNPISKKRANIDIEYIEPIELGNTHVVGSSNSRWYALFAKIGAKY